MASLDAKFAPAGFFQGLANSIGRFSDLLTSAYAMDHRYDEVLRLQAKSDEELAAMGLTREKIAAHVFRDMIYV